MEKIKSITLRNFKFFYGTEVTQSQNKLKLDGNHLLLYGENGSGKSSLYWALYTFLQSAIKSEQDQIEKYFNPNHSQNLRNRFADDDHESGIEIEFQSPAGEITKRLRRRRDRTYELNCFQDTDILKVLEGSDFINYKFLSKIYDFRNSEAIDLFPMFERDILMFIDFEQAYTDHNDNLTSETYASNWWEFINNAPNYFSPSGTAVRVGTDKYKRFKNSTIPRFVELLKTFLVDITQEVNRLLKDEFCEDFTVDFNVESIECDYNKSISQRAKDGIIHRPKIPLKVNFNTDKLTDTKKLIAKPHTFLNEARLTAIALAIRLAILDRRPVFPNTARILVLDDLLLSLDMSHRDKVLDIILSDSFINTYQLMIFSHDKSFYNLCKRRIQDRFKEGWVFKEVYQHETDTGIPCPFIPDQKDYLDLAKKYLKEFDYPASANYLRKEAEKVLKHLLPENLQYKIGNKLESELINLDGLITAFL
ncbi:AAA family ATPase, partial [Empedobacter sp.]|uniref:AAA family ATPase n=1 Tax=Empedobacter sp. TaxID=1927715 RepID=UPI0028B00D75